MDLIQSYNEEAVSSSPESSPPHILNAKSSTPEVDYTELDLTAANVDLLKSKPINFTDEHLYYSPAHQYAEEIQNHKLGLVEDASIDSFVYNTFHEYGYVGDMDSMKRRKIENKKKKGEKKEEIEPEAEDPTWLLKNSKSPWSRKKEVVDQGELTEEQKKYAEEHAKKKKDKAKQDEATEENKSIFHGKEEKDYQGKSWIEAPKDAQTNNDHCYIPKRLVHTWSGHTKGVSAIRFFPKQGHLLLSAGMDSKVKIWDVHNNNSGKCMRTYMGHTKAVKDICFSNDGTNFLTAGFDNKIKFWDTETGQVISTFSTGKVPYVVKLNPDDDKQNVLLAGMSDKKIVQWDINTGKITQEYNQHLGAVNTITFVDSNRRFITSSDDQSLRVWEFGIPVVIKCISEPYMHSMPSVSVHPDGNWIAAQSLDNQIMVYSSRERFHVNEKKRFTGHVVAGYACQVNFSPDGRFVMSGDGQGKCWFWDWKSCKVFKTLKCHNGVCIGAEWHPLEPSKVATCGWDGLIKYWD